MNRPPTQRCPCCGAQLVVLPSKTITNVEILCEIENMITLAEDLMEQMERDPDARARLGEFLPTETLDDAADDDSQP